MFYIIKRLGAFASLREAQVNTSILSALHYGGLEAVSKLHLRPNGCVAPLARDSHLIL
jgi:hypothetical protein